MCSESPTKVVAFLEWRLLQVRFVDPEKAWPKAGVGGGGEYSKHGAALPCRPRGTRLEGAHPWERY